MTQDAATSVHTKTCTHTDAESLAAFDRLPPAYRAVLNEAANCYCALCVEAMQLPFDRFERAIRRTDEHIAAQWRKQEATQPCTAP